MIKKLKHLFLCQVILWLGMGLGGCSAQLSKHSGELYNPSAARINTRLGVAYLKRRQYPRAKAKLLKAYAQNPHSLTTLNALAYYWELVGDIKNARHYYHTALKQAPHAGQTLNNYGAFLCRQGQLQQGLEHLLQAAHERDYVGSAKAYENAGLCALKLQQRGRAKDYFAQAVKQNPQLGKSLQALIKLYQQDNQEKLAQTYQNRYNKLVACPKID
jgi:type IV pilus assembly protein PilF